MITGILYVHCLEPFIAGKHLETLSSYIRENVTTIVSESFIRLALDGIFSRRITDIGDSPGTDSIWMPCLNWLKLAVRCTDSIGDYVIIQETGDEIMGKKVVLALGGNAILQPKQEATFENQYQNVVNAANRMVEISEAGHKIVCNTR